MIKLCFINKIVDHTFLEKQFLEEKKDGHFVRSRAKWVELGEKPTK